MKKYILIFISCLGLLSCEDYLDKKPLDKEVEATFFTTYANCLIYSYQFYSWYPGYATGNNVNILFDAYSDNGFIGKPNNENPYAWDKVVSTSYTATGSNGWRYTNIRTVQVLLDNIDGIDMSEVEKNHWRSVGYFFKAQEYFTFLNRFGQAMWLEKVLLDTDTEELYGSAIGRVELAEKIYDMLIFARDNIKVDGDGANTINKKVVNALMSRFGLFEGTWQKYHAIAGGDPKKYLQASFDASSALIVEHPSVHGNYSEVFSSTDLATVPTVLLYKNYVRPEQTSRMLRIRRAAASVQEATADLVQSYLCQDGKPIWTSADYAGDKATGDDIMNVEFRNRDHRLYISICPPFRVDMDANSFWPKDAAKVKMTGDPMDAEYFPIVENLVKGSSANRFLPLLQWNSQYSLEQPHFRGRYSMRQNFILTYGGYYPWKHYTSDDQSEESDIDAPIYRMGEVMINHAEAAWELGRFNQAVADATINKLRSRANVAAMNVAEITAGFDPKRDMGGYSSDGPADYEVNPVLWEIRRERRVELYCEGLRLDDIRRWAKGHYLNKTPKGAYVRKKDYELNTRYIAKKQQNLAKFDLKLEDPSKDAGRIAYFGKPPGWKSKYYLYAIPLNDLTLNPNLKQNPGYETVN